MNDLTAPNIDSCIAVIGRLFENPCLVAPPLFHVIERLYNVCNGLKPVGADLRKVLWLRVPRGTFEDFRRTQFQPYKPQKLWSTGKGYWVQKDVDETDWKAAYPEDYSWYKLELLEEDGWRMVGLNGRAVLSSLLEEGDGVEAYDANAFELCQLLIIAARQSMEQAACDPPYRYKSGTVKAQYVTPDLPGDTIIGIMPCFVSSRDVQYPIPDEKYGLLEHFMHVDDADIAAFGDKIEWEPSPV